MIRQLNKRASTPIAAIVFALATLVLCSTTLFVFSSKGMVGTKKIILSKIIDDVYVSRERFDFYLKQASYDSLIKSYEYVSYYNKYVSDSCKNTALPEGCSAVDNLFGEAPCLNLELDNIFANSIKENIKEEFNNYDFGTEQSANELKKGILADDFTSVFSDKNQLMNITKRINIASFEVKRKENLLDTNVYSFDDESKQSIAEDFLTREDAKETSLFGAFKKVSVQSYFSATVIHPVLLYVNAFLYELELKSFSFIWDTSSSCITKELGYEDAKNQKIKECFYNGLGKLYFVEVKTSCKTRCEPCLPLAETGKRQMIKSITLESNRQFIIQEQLKKIKINYAWQIKDEACYCSEA